MSRTSTYRSGHCDAAAHHRCTRDYGTAVCGCTCHTPTKARR